MDFMSNNKKYPKQSEILQSIIDLHKLIILERRRLELFYPRQYMQSLDLIYFAVLSHLGNELFNLENITEELRKRGE